MSEQTRNISNRTTSQREPLVGESILYDIFIKYGSPTDEKIQQLERMFESRIKSLASQKQNSSDIPHQKLLLECACDLYTQMVFAFNILLTGIIDPDEHLKFFFEQTAYIDRHMLQIPNLIEKRLRALASPRTNERKLAKAFIKLIKQAYYIDIPNRLRF